MTAGLLPNEGDPIDIAAYPMMFETPYVVWTNYNTGVTDWPERVSPAKLGLMTFKLSGVSDIPVYMGIIDEFYSKYNVFQQYIAYDKDGVWVPEVPEEEQVAYRQIQYDILNGKQYVLENAEEKTEEE